MRATYVHNVVCSGISFFSHGVFEEWYLWNDMAMAKQHVPELKRQRLAHAEKKMRFLYIAMVVLLSQPLSSTASGIGAFVSLLIALVFKIRS